jgi:Kef-type K+ transport system membrane component KefB
MTANRCRVALSQFIRQTPRPASHALGLLGLTLLAVMGGKFAGVYAAARPTGMAARPACAPATLMNTRGLTELVLLTVGNRQVCSAHGCPRSRRPWQC